MTPRKNVHITGGALGHHECEAKIRELEAELMKERSLRYAYAGRIEWVRQVAKEQARAEKAELHASSLEQALRNEQEIRKKETDINLKLKARVAETKP